MKQTKAAIAAATALALLAGCAQSPMGPRVAVMPAPGKPFDVFQQDDAVCRQFAQQQSAGVAEQANNAQLGSAAIGTLLGAGLGAAAGGGRGAAIGAASGAGIGTAYGASASTNANYTIQQRYDIAYEQCMYAKGNLLPGQAAPYHASVPPPPPASYYPPPPPGSYPPPPPGPPPAPPPQ